MYVWWASALIHEILVQQVVELAREKLACVIRVKAAHHAHGSWGVSAGIGVDRGDESADASGCVRLTTQEVDKFEPSVVVHQDERVLVVADRGWLEGANDVGVYQTTSVCGRVATA
eukprot:7271751-Prymnesium_polylepis.2